ncbi:MAG: hypothetical protein JNM67_08275, partial [Bacteroidetes bacterium]|nr:hypothetical protein [Bacteroidota bacterium]
MRKIYIPFIVLNLIFTSCTSEFNSFNANILSFANNDRKIDQREYQELIEQILGSDEKGFQQFKNKKGEIDNAKFVTYLLKYFKAKNISLTINDIWKSESLSKKETFNINVYLENSGSMNG